MEKDNHFIITEKFENSGEIHWMKLVKDSEGNLTWIKAEKPDYYGEK